MKKKVSKPNPLKVFNDNKAAAYKKAGGAMKDFKKSLPKAQKGTPFQEYMKTPGAVASDTVMARKPFGKTYDNSSLNKPVAKNSQNTNKLINAAEKTYGMDVWDRPWSRPNKNKYLTPAEEKEFREKGSLKKGGSTKRKKK